jgi:hypothetical protein
MFIICAPDLGGVNNFGLVQGSSIRIDSCLVSSTFEPLNVTSSVLCGMASASTHQGHDQVQSESDGEPEEIHDRGHAIVRVEFPNRSTISLYSDGRFEAVCRHPDHTPSGKCRLTRTSCESADPGAEAQGRPLGLLSAWVLATSDFSTREEHCNVFALYILDSEARQAARNRLLALPGGALLLEAERAPREAEGPEPAGWA